MEDIEFLKHNIRAILLSLGKCATEREFRTEWQNTEGESFNKVLAHYNTTFFNFFSRMPDVAAVSYTPATGVILTRVSNANSRHMDNMTVVKYSKNYKGIKVKVGANNVPRLMPSKGPPMFSSFNHVGGRNVQVVRPIRRLPPAPPAASFNANRNRAYIPPLQQQRPVASVDRNQHVQPATISNFNRNVAPPQISARPSVQHRPADVSSNSNSFSQPQRPSEYSRPTSSQAREFVPIDWGTVSVSSRAPPQPTPAQAPSTCSRQQQPPPPQQSSISQLVQGVDNISIQSTPPKAAPAKSVDVKLPTNNRMESLRLFQWALEQTREDAPNTTVPPKVEVDDAFKLTSEMPRYHFGDKAFFVIKIYDVESPARFTFQYSLEELKHLRQSMTRHYDNIRDWKNYLVSEVKLGMTVATRHPDDQKHWYRAEITEIESEKLTVRFIDYLTVKHYNIRATDIYRLEKEFASESPKSAFGRLHGIKPKQSSEWNLESKMELRNSRDEPMMATIKKHADDVYALSIIMGGNDFNRMLDYMVKNKYADIDFDDFCKLESKGMQSLV